MGVESTSRMDDVLSLVTRGLVARGWERSAPIYGKVASLHHQTQPLPGFEPGGGRPDLDLQRNDLTGRQSLFAAMGMKGLFRS